MTGLTVFLIVVGLVVLLFAFDFLRTRRAKKSLAAGGRAPFQGAGSRASEGVSSDNLAQQSASTTKMNGSGYYP